MMMSCVYHRKTEFSRTEVCFKLGEKEEKEEKKKEKIKEEKGEGGEN